MKEEGTVVITVLQMRKLRYRETERLAQVPTGNKPSGRDANLSTAALESEVFRWESGCGCDPSFQPFGVILEWWERDLLCTGSYTSGEKGRG